MPAIGTLLRTLRARSASPPVGDGPRRSLLLLMMVAMGLLPGCNMLLPTVFVSEHKKKILAEYDKLPGTRTAILVWAPTETTFDYPHIELELADHIAAYLGVMLNQGGSSLDIVDPRDIADFLQREPRAKSEPTAVGEHFNADRVVFVELLQFQVRDPTAPSLLQGHLHAAVSVYDLSGTPDGRSRNELTAVEIYHPEGTPVLLGPTNASVIRKETYRKFAETVARKFYDHTVDL